MGSREDDEYWNTKYAEASCHEHGDAEMYYDPNEGEWGCYQCDEDDAIGVIYNYG
jgi:hypothetical protein